ncbi:MAG: hypothetical protein N2C14_13980 [Planctomycetales bacterium]
MYLLVRVAVDRNLAASDGRARWRRFVAAIGRGFISPPDDSPRPFLSKSKNEQSPFADQGIRAIRRKLLAQFNLRRRFFAAAGTGRHGLGF